MSGLEWCEIRRWRGYSTSAFYAATASGELLAESAPFRWRKSAPPPETADTRAAHDALVAAVTADGWTAVDEDGDAWYETRFMRPAREPVADPEAVPAVEVAPAVSPPVPAPAPPPTPAPAPAPATPPARELPAPPAATQPPPPPQPEPIAPGSRRQRRWRIAIAAGTVALAAAGLAALPATFRGVPHSPAADAARASVTTTTRARAAARTRVQPAAKSQARAATPPTTRTTAAAQRRPLVDLRIVAHGNGSWMEIHRRSASGPTLYRATLEPGQQLHLRGARLWARFGAAGNLTITDNGRPVRLTGTPEKVFVP